MQLKILPTIKSPEDLRKLNKDQLLQLADELRHFTIETITEIGGHLAPTLGVIDLTIALHKVFNTPEDKIIWDVGHQTYPHKILTGRKERIRKKDRFFSGIKIKSSFIHSNYKRTMARNEKTGNYSTIV